MRSEVQLLLDPPVPLVPPQGRRIPADQIGRTVFGRSFLSDRKTRQLTAPDGDIRPYDIVKRAKHETLLGRSRVGERRVRRLAAWGCFPRAAKRQDTESSLSKSMTLTERRPERPSPVAKATGSSRLPTRAKERVGLSHCPQVARSAVGQARFPQKGPSSSGSDQAREGRLVDALAARGDEGRGTLR